MTGQFKAAGLDFTVADFVKPVSQDLKDLDISSYDVAVVYNSADLVSLKENFPDWKQGNTLIAAFGNGTKRALEEAGFRVDIEAGQGLPFASLPLAIADYLEKNE